MDQASAHILFKDLPIFIQCVLIGIFIVTMSVLTVIGDMVFNKGRSFRTLLEEENQEFLTAYSKGKEKKDMTVHKDQLELLAVIVGLVGVSALFYYGRQIKESVSAVVWMIWQIIKPIVS